MSTQLALAKLQCTLVLAHLEQFHDALFIRSLTGNLTDYVAHELDALGKELWLRGCGLEMGGGSE